MRRMSEKTQSWRDFILDYCNRSVLKEINPSYSLEGLILKRKL